MKQTGIKWMLLGIAVLILACFCCLYVIACDPNGGEVMGILCGWGMLILPIVGLAFCLFGFFYKPKAAPRGAEKDSKSQSE